MVESLSYWEVFTSSQFLGGIFDSSVSQGKAAGRDGVTPVKFASQIEDEISVIQRKLMAGTYRFSAFGQVLQSKGAGRAPREISLPTTRDRVVLRAMANVLHWAYPEASVPLAQDVVAKVIATLRRGDYSHYARLDIRDFYPSIGHGIVREATSARLDERFVDLFMRAIATPTLARSERHQSQLNEKGVPQGLSISNGLAELVLRDVDEVLPASECAYFRYVDDILILGTGEDIPQFAAQVRHAISRLGLNTHDEGSAKAAHGRIAGGFEYLGYRFEWPRVTVRASSVQRLEGSIARAFTRHKYDARVAKGPVAQKRRDDRLQWNVDLLVAGCVFEGRRRGWLAYYSQIRHHQLLHHLDDLIARQRARHGLQHLSFKSFVDAYRFAASKKEDETGFVPNFDVSPVSEVRTMLSSVFGIPPGEVEKFTDDQARELFTTRLRSITASLERDVASDY